MRNRLWEDDREDRRTSATRRTATHSAPSRTATDAPATRKVRKFKNGFGDNWPVRLVITYVDGSQDIFVGDEIDADNPVINALVTIRTTRRFWRLNLADTGTMAGGAVYSTDEELLRSAYALGYRSTDPVEIGRILNCVAEWYVTGEDGEPAVDERGNWIPATPPIRGFYAPGTHRPAAAPYTPGPAAAPYTHDPAAAPYTPGPGAGSTT